MAGLDVVAVAAAGACAGIFGALLGIGGGVFLVPFLVTALGLSFPLARGISLATVVATSSAVSAATGGRGLVNVRLAMLLQVATATGGLSGSLTSRIVSERALSALFALVMLLVAGVMLARINRRNLTAGVQVDPGLLGGYVHDPELGHTVAYRVRRLPVAVLVSFLSGNVSSLLGIGGGVVMVPALNSWCGIPMRVAAATSAFMIGVTATAALPLYWAHGEILPHLAAAGVLGVLAGSRIGIQLVTRLQVRWLKMLMIAVLIGVAAVMIGRLW
jgi:uncharacterized membrane protein YfcA